MAFRLFDFRERLDEITSSAKTAAERLELLHSELGESSFPTYLKRYIEQTSDDLESALAIHSSSSIAGYSDKEEGLDKKRIERRRGFFGNPQLEKNKYPRAIHHLKIFTNAEAKGRLFYKNNLSIQFIQNVRR
jgi:hypothetical protein